MLGDGSSIRKTWLTLFDDLFDNIKVVIVQKQPHQVVVGDIVLFRNKCFTVVSIQPRKNYKNEITEYDFVISHNETKEGFKCSPHYMMSIKEIK